MALELCRQWLNWGLQPYILSLQRAVPELGPDFERLGVPILLCDFAERGYWRYLKLVKEVHRRCQAVRPAALLSMPAGIHAFISAGAWLAGVRSIAVHNGTYPWYWHREAFRKYRLEFQLGRPFTNKVVSCSYYVDQGTAEHLSVGQKARTVVYNGVDVCAAASVRRDRGEPAGTKKPVITMVGRLDRTKDHSTLIGATAVLRRHGHEMELRLIGSGRAEQTLRRKALDLGVDKHVSFKGARSDVYEQLGRSDIFAYSVNREEGLGIALIEAMAVGLPIVASDVPACREVLDDGRAGLLVEPGDPAAMAAGIEAVLARPIAAQQRAEYARERSRNVFSTEAMARGYAEVLALPVPQGVRDTTGQYIEQV